MIALIDCRRFQRQESPVYIASEDYACVQKTVFWLIKSLLLAKYYFERRTRQA